MLNEQEVLERSALGPYRVLDLTEGGCLLAGKVLADLGADVIKVEPPAGSPSRIAPFYKDVADVEKSLFWFAYCANERGITLDITKAEGQEIFKRLVKTADILIESFRPGHMDELGLGYSSLQTINPGLIVTSITLFGQSGPKSSFVGCDLTAWASGGTLYLAGQPDRPPVWVSFPQASLLGGAAAASASVTALWHRQRTGQAQQADVSLQECSIVAAMNAPAIWDLNKVEFMRSGSAFQVAATGVRLSQCVRCKDGYIAMYIMGGGTPSYVTSMRSLVQWMDEEGVAPEWLKKVDWVHDYDASKLTQDFVNLVEGVIGEFALTKTKREFFEESLKRRILAAPACDAKDITENLQLRSRDYWVSLKYAELGDELIHCGPFAKLSESSIILRRRAPLIGEHNTEIYERELGMPTQDLIRLRQDGVI